MRKHLVEGVEAIQLPVDLTDAPPAGESVMPKFISYAYNQQPQRTTSISQLAGQPSIGDTPIANEDKKK